MSLLHLFRVQALFPVSASLNAKRLSNACQAFIACPQLRVGSKLSRGQQVQIHKTKALTHKTMAFKKEYGFLMTGYNGARKILPKRDQLLPVLQMTTGRLARNHRVDRHLSLRKQLRECFITVAQMIHPNRSVNQNHYSGPARRLGTGLKSASEPPKAARGSPSSPGARKKPSPAPVECRTVLPTASTTIAGNVTRE